MILKNADRKEEMSRILYHLPSRMNSIFVKNVTFV